MKILCWLLGHKWRLIQVWKSYDKGEWSVLECSRCHQHKTIEE